MIKLLKATVLLISSCFCNFLANLLLKLLFLPFLNMKSFFLSQSLEVNQRETCSTTINFLSRITRGMRRPTPV